MYGLLGGRFFHFIEGIPGALNCKKVGVFTGLQVWEVGVHTDKPGLCRNL